MSKYRTTIEDVANLTFPTYQLVVDSNSKFGYSVSVYQGPTVSSILLGAALDRQNAARIPVIGGVEELARSTLPIQFRGVFGDQASIGPANIMMSEIRRWVTFGWMDPSVLERVGPGITNAQMDLIGEYTFAIQAMRVKLHEG